MTVRLRPSAHFPLFTNLLFELNIFLDLHKCVTFRTLLGVMPAVKFSSRFMPLKTCRTAHKIAILIGKILKSNKQKMLFRR